jgi:hypothetical protein
VSTSSALQPTYWASAEQAAKIDVVGIGIEAAISVTEKERCAER